MSEGGSRSGITAVIVDDEPLARENLRLLLQRHADISVLGEADDVTQARTLLERTQPDLVFLDIRMPHGDGFDVLEDIDLATPPFVVFVTAFDDYAVRAFGARAIDYLLKPFDDARFEATLANARQRIAEHRAARLGSKLQEWLDERRGVVEQNPAARQAAGRLLIKERDRAFVMPLRDVMWIEANGPYVRIHTDRGAHLMRTSISTLAGELDPRLFIRIHRGALVNLDFVQEFQPYFHGDYIVVLRGGTRLRMSRRRRAALEWLLGQGVRRC